MRTVGLSTRSDGALRPGAGGGGGPGGEGGSVRSSLPANAEAVSSCESHEIYKALPMARAPKTSAGKMRPIRCGDGMLGLSGLSAIMSLANVTRGRRRGWKLTALLSPTLLGGFGSSSVV